MTASLDSFGARDTLTVGDDTYSIFRLDKVEGAARLPYSLKVLLENLMRNEDGTIVTADQVRAVAEWDPAAEHGSEVQYTPARVLLQDFTGVPCVVDLVAMRDAMKAFDGDPQKINPLVPVELVIDHSVIADVFGRSDAFRRNAELEFERNQERYQLLRWAQQAFDDFSVVPPDTGICHQVNLEYLARVVFTREGPDGMMAYPDTLVGTDSHTPMVNGLGVLGWGVGGIEAEAAMLGQPMSMLVPPVLGFKLTGELPDGATATDLVLTVAQILRQTGVVGKFVEFYGPGVANVPLANRATLGNMSPEYGSTCAIFPIDDETLSYLRLTGRDAKQIALVEAYAKEQGLWHDPDHEPAYSQTIELDLSTVEASIAGPKRPQDRIALSQAQHDIRTLLAEQLPEQSVPTPVGLDEASSESFPASDPVAVTGNHQADKPTGPCGDGAANGWPSEPVPVKFADGTTATIDHGAVVIAAITSCTNTSNPSVMVGAGLLAKKAVERGLTSKPWVKTSLAPGSRVVTDYYNESGLTPYLEKLGFNLVGYGCTTCIGNSGPLIPEVADAVEEHDLNVSSVLSGNRNFEGRIHSQTKMNFLTSPPLVVAYAIAGSMHVDLTREPLGVDPDGEEVYLKDIWPSRAEIKKVVDGFVEAKMFTKGYADVFAGDDNWKSLEIPSGDMFAWQDSSTYVRSPSFFDGMPREPQPLRDISGARVLALLGDSVTTDHISPAGAIKKDSPAGRYLLDKGVSPRDFNSYGSRRGNHEVMIRGTFANIRLRNQLVPGVEGGFTRHLPDGAQMDIFDAAEAYASENVPLLVIAGADYGSGSSRDWAAKGTLLLGVSAVLATSFERIHRSNLIGMGVLPLQFRSGETAESLGLTGEELYSITGLAEADDVPREVNVHVESNEGARDFTAVVRIDTPAEAAYYRHGGILQYVLRQLLDS
jgi:aconitate hydratase